MPAAIGAAMARMLRTIEPWVRSFIGGYACAKTVAKNTRCGCGTRWRKRSRSAASGRVRYAPDVTASPLIASLWKTRQRRALLAAAAALCLVGIALAAPRPFRQYPGVEYYDFELPTDYQTAGEWSFARLMYP